MADPGNGDGVRVQLAGIRLGASSMDVRRVLGEPDRRFHRAQSPRPTEVWEDRGVFVTYDAREQVALVEVAEGDPTVSGVHVMRRPLADAIADLAEADVVFEPDDHGAGGRIVGWGVALYVEVGIVKAVSIGW